MSGIAGLYRPDGRSVARDDLATQLATLDHRGRDGRGSWHGGHVGLGHQHLLATPEAAGEAQPIVDGSGDRVLTADVRLDNRDELVAALGLADGATDAELVLAAYDRWGSECPARLLGAFAFALWDGRAERLLLARDRLGVKPLYYADGDGVAFGSEPKAVLAAPGVTRRLDPIRMGDHLVGLAEDTERTFYRDVRRLPPAHMLCASPAGTERRRYWSLDPDRRVRYPSDDAYAAAFRELFREAVRCRLRSPKPVGTMLSGGLDSSSIACVAREALPAGRSFHTVSAVFDDVPACDEREYIDAVLDAGDFTPHVVRADRVSPLVDLEAMHHHHDEPIGPPNHFMHWSLYREAADSGVRVLLDGIDGDTTVSHGRGRMADLARRGRVVQLSREAVGFARNFDRPLRRVAFNRVLAPLAPGPVRRGWRRVRRTDGPARAHNPMLRPAFIERVGLDERVRRLGPDGSGGGLSAHERHHRKLTSGLVPFTLEHTDRAAAAFGIEPRYPFFDTRLVEFCLALPTDQKIRRGWTRLVLRRAMDGILPGAVQWRGGKADLSPNFYRGLSRFERDRMAALFRADPSVIADYVDIDAARAELERFRTADDPGSEAAVMALWYGLTLGVWLRSVEGRPESGTVGRRGTFL